MCIVKSPFLFSEGLIAEQFCYKLALILLNVAAVSEQHKEEVLVSGAGLYHRVVVDCRHYAGRAAVFNVVRPTFYVPYFPYVLRVSK